MDTPEFKQVIRGYDRKAVDHAWADMQQQLFECTIANNELRLQIDALREQYSESNVVNNELHQQFNSLREQYSASTVAHNELRSQIDSLREQYSESNVVNNELRSQIDSLQEQNSASTAANNELRLQIDSLQEQNSASTAANNELHLQIDSLQEQNSASTAANNELHLRIDSLQEQNSASTAANNELRLQIDNLQEQNSECKNRVKHYEQIEKDIMDVLLSAQRIANQVKEEATKQADDLIQSARSESETLLNETTRSLKLKEHDAETSLIHKQSQIILLEEQIRGLSEQKTELQTRVAQAINFSEMALGLLGPPKILPEQDSK